MGTRIVDMLLILNFGTLALQFILPPFGCLCRVRGLRSRASRARGYCSSCHIWAACSSRNPADGSVHWCCCSSVRQIWQCVGRFRSSMRLFVLPLEGSCGATYSGRSVGAQLWQLGLRVTRHGPTPSLLHGRFATAHPPPWLSLVCRSFDQFEWTLVHSQDWRICEGMSSSQPLAAKLEILLAWCPGIHPLHVFLLRFFAF